MKTIVDIYNTKNGIVIVESTSELYGLEIDSKRVKYINEQAQLYMKKFPSFGLIRVYDNGRDAKLEFNKPIIVTLHNYKNIKINDIKPIISLLKKNGVSLKSNKYKLQKNNKYAGGVIVALMLATSVVLSTPFIISNVVKKKDINDNTSEIVEIYEPEVLTAKEEIEHTSLYLSDIEVDQTEEETTKEEVTKEEATIEETTTEETTIPEVTEPEYSDNYTDTVYIDYEDRSDIEKARKTKEEYGDIIKKYCDRYGLDYRVMCAIAIQERGVHSSYVDDGGAIGLFQIQVSAWDGEYLTVKNKNGENETIYINLDDLRDIDFNVRVGCAIFKYTLDLMHGNYLAAIQCYNMGEGSMYNILKACSYDYGISIDEIKDNKSNVDWINYRSIIRWGDQYYLEHVISYIGSDFVLDGVRVSNQQKRY